MLVAKINCIRASADLLTSTEKDDNDKLKKVAKCCTTAIYDIYALFLSAVHYFCHVLLSFKVIINTVPFYSFRFFMQTKKQHLFSRKKKTQKSQIIFFFFFFNCLKKDQNKLALEGGASS